MQRALVDAQELMMSGSKCQNPQKPRYYQPSETLRKAGQC
jgi:hypothetical protein